MTNTEFPDAAVLPPPPHVVDGERLRLRDIEADDANETYVGWMNDPEVNRYTESRFSPHTPESIRRYIETITSTDDSLFLAIVEKETGHHIGNIKLGDIDRHHGTAEVGIIIGDKNCWGRGYGCEAIDILAGYAFATLGLRKLTAGFYVTNTGSIRAFEKAGFVVEGVMKEQYISDGKAINAVRLGRLRLPSSVASET